MANSSVAITAGSGTNIDTRTATDGDHRQVVCLGDDGSNNVATLTVAGTKNTVDVNLAASGGGTAAVSGTLTGSGVSVSATIGNSGNGTIVIYGGTYTNLPVAFEASVDGTNWFPVDAARADSSQIVSSTILPSTGVFAWNYMATGYTNVRVRQSGAAGAQTGNPSVIITQGPFLIDPSPTIALLDGQKDTYCISVSGIASNFAGDFFWLKGSASRLARLTRLEVTLTVTGTITAAGIVLALLKRVSADTGGTAGTVPTTMAIDTVQGGAATTSGTYTAVPTHGSLAGTVRHTRFQAAATTYTWSWDFGGGRPSKCPTLRGTAEQLCLNQSAAIAGTVPVTAWTIVAEITEEPL